MQLGARLNVEAWMLPAAIIKGAIVAALVLGVAEVGFLQAVAVAATSATITGIFLVVATYIQARQTGQKVDDVRVKVGEVKRVADAVAETVDARELRDVKAEGVTENG